MTVAFERVVEVFIIRYLLEPGELATNTRLPVHQREHGAVGVVVVEQFGFVCFGGVAPDD